MHDEYHFNTHTSIKFLQKAGQIFLSKKLLTVFDFFGVYLHVANLNR